MGDGGEVAGHRLHVVAEPFLERPGGQLEAGGQVQETGDDGQARQDPERHDDAGTRLVGFAVAPELAEEGQVHATGHVGGGQRRRQHAHAQHQRVGAVASGAAQQPPSAGPDQDLVLGPEPRQGR